MMESKYWLKVIKAIIFKKDSELDFLLSEAEELSKILGAIAVKTKR